MKGVHLFELHYWCNKCNVLVGFPFETIKDQWFGKERATLPRKEGVLRWTEQGKLIQITKCERCGQKFE